MRFKFLGKSGILYKLLVCVIIASLVIIVVGLSFCGVFKRIIYPIKYEQVVIEKADKYKLDRALVFSIINSESKFKPNAVSKKGAKGLMQLMDETAEFIANRLGENEYNVYDVQTNVEFGCYYFRYLIRKFKDIKLAIVAYNAGEGNVSEWLENQEYSLDGKSLNKIPFKESEEYLEKVEKGIIEYRKLYGNIVDK